MTMNQRDPSAHRSTASQRLPRRLAARSVAGLLCLSLATTPVAFGQSSKARPQGGEPVTLNFVNADIEGVTRAMAAILKQQFIVDPRVKGTITLYSEDPLSPREAYLNFLAALRGLGFTVVEAGGIYKVVPEADAKLQSATVSIGDVSRKGDQVLTQIFRLNHENANNLVPVLRPLISPNNTINANPGNNTLIITDYADNLARIGKIIAAMDTPAGGEVEVIPVQHAIASDIAALVQRLSDAGGGLPGVPGAAGGTAASVLVDARSNSLLVRAPNPARMAMIKALVEKLDRPVGDGNAMGNIWVVYLKNADAVKLATVLRAAYGSGGGSGGGATAAIPATPATPGGAPGTSSQAAAPIAQSASPSTGGFVQADPSTNSLIITAPEPMYRQLRAIIEQLDSRRAQVYVEALIVEVDADRAAELGIQWQGISGNKGDTNILGLGTNFGTGINNILGASQLLAQGVTGLAQADPTSVNGVNFAVAHQIGSRYTLGLLARALESNTGANVLSTPNLVTLDNEEAKIVVGQNVPFVTGSFTNTGTATTSPFQTIERKDVGLTLRIRPQIGEGNTVRMTIFQESSAVVAPAAGTANAGPSTTKRSIESTVVVDDGEIIVLGGLIEDNYTDTRSKVPVLGDIPLIGGLFRTENRSRKKTNLMVFLRPVVMRTQDAATRLSLDRYDLIRNLQLDTQPEPRILVPVNSAPTLPLGPTAAPGAPITGSPGLPTKEALPAPKPAAPASSPQ
jgi:general secretion pathway protein D